MKIIVTGATGFIGKALTEKLVNSKHSVVALSQKNGDIANCNYYDNVEARDAVHVFHLAARTFVPDSWTDPESFYRVNVNGTLNTLEFCRRHNLSLTFVSAYLYGQPERIPIAEDSRIAPNNPYAHSKVLAEQLCEFYAREYGLAITVIRPFNIYGPGQSDRFLIPHILRQALGSDVIQIKDLAPKRDYVFIDDLVEALTLTCKPRQEYAVYNIGSGTSTSVGQIIDLIESLMGTQKEIICENNIRHNELDEVIADITRARNVLCWVPKVFLTDGLKRMIDLAKGGFSNG